MTFRKPHSMIPLAQRQRRHVPTMLPFDSTPLDQVRVHRHLSRAIRDAGFNVGRGPLQIEILCLLHDHDAPAVASRNLLPILAVHPTTLSQALNSLRSKRLVRSVPHPTHQRAELIQTSAPARGRAQPFFR